MKGNRQGSLSRWIKRLLKLFRVSKSSSLSKIPFRQAGAGAAAPALFAVRPAVGAFLQGRRAFYSAVVHTFVKSMS